MPLEALEMPLEALEMPLKVSEMTLKGSVMPLQKSKTPLDQSLLKGGKDGNWKLRNATSLIPIPFCLGWKVLSISSSISG